MEATVVDVVVIGGGGAGLAAAAEAAALGRRVVLLEKNPQLGGSTGWSIGSVTATNTPHQKRAGVRDSADEHFEDLAKFAGDRVSRDNLGLRRVLVDNITDTFNWLTSLGIVFSGPMPEPPHRHPRMHNVVPNSKAFPYYVGKHCRSLGVDIRLATKALSFIVEEGEVRGVVAQTSGEGERAYRARHGVVLASGDFSGNREMLAEYANPIAAACDPFNPSSTGDGHRMAIEIGASVLNGDLVHGPIMRFVPPPADSLIRSLPPYRIFGQAANFAMRFLPQSLLRPVLMSFVTTALGVDPGLYRAGAILVNTKGERFTDELDKPAADLVRQPGGVCYVVFDERIARQFTAWPHFISTAPSVAYAYLPDYKRTRRDIYHEGRTVAELAGKLGMEPGLLHASLDGRGVDAAHALSPPFTALGPIKNYIVITEGGLKVSDDLEVLGPDNAPIRNLYAAGSAGQGGLLLYGHGHHVGWAFVSGRRAGRHAAMNKSNQATA